MTKYLIYGIIMCVIIIIVLIKKVIEYRNERKMFAYVGWCVTKNSQDLRLALRICDYIHNAQNKIDLEKEYRLTENEMPLVEKVLKQYKEDLLEDYFLDRLVFPLKSKYAIYEDVQFFYQFFVYLQNHECDRTIDGEDTFKRIEYISHGSWGAELYDSTNELTDMGIVFVKLHLIAGLFCQNNEIINPNKIDYRLDYLKEEIDTQIIKISRY